MRRLAELLDDRFESNLDCLFVSFGDEAEGLGAGFGLGRILISDLCDGMVEGKERYSRRDI